MLHLPPLVEAGAAEEPTILVRTKQWSARTRCRRSDGAPSFQWTDFNDRTMRNRLGKRFAGRQVEQRSKQHPTEHLVRHEQRCAGACRRDGSQRPLRSNVGVGVALPLRETPPVLLTFAAAQFPRVHRLNICIGEAGEASVMHLGEVIEHVDGVLGSSGDHGRCSPCATKRAREDRIDRRFADQGRDDLSVPDSIVGEWRVQLPLAPTEPIPLRLTVPHEENALEGPRHGSSLAPVEASRPLRSAESGITDHRVRLRSDKGAGSRTRGGSGHGPSQRGERRKRRLYSGSPPRSPT